MEKDIIGIFDEAEAKLAAGVERAVYIFLDEINTCTHMGLLSEAICLRSLHGRPFHPGIQLLCALNPYRKRRDLEDTPGLVFQGRVQQDEMRSLVYRVHPIPDTLQDFLFDFGSLSSDNELLYIQAMIHTHILVDYTEPEHTLISHLVQASQAFVRDAEGDSSATSLRDVKRCLDLMNWFSEILTVKPKGGGGEPEKTQQLLPRTAAIILALAFVYYFRLKNNNMRSNYWNCLRRKGEWTDRHLKQLG